MSVPSIETRIFEAIKARVASLPMASSYDIVWTAGDNLMETGSGASYAPSPTKRYLRCTWTPNATQRRFLKGTDPHQRMGVIQIDVMGLKSQSTGVAREAAGQVAAHFPADQPMRFMGAQLRVMKAPAVFSPIVGTHVQVPVQIEVRTFA